ncbi:Gfo/Idh/MocA family oxidoreductase [Streptomyces sp. SP18CS02]|uniref:Gfo/Idh/MocA family oxidoreductase n=1 Tax=Streptomyces sp. SP18CS02 TaxID=3002531 RepID=UPI002E7992EB|nr:Gfo/Idh/MocA family oxidoreductase [Streptomyces sp. SP18CS02]MEE1753364.1 Gfo/Idh/MocA family oxidoreductase [Streptomyces sp. SP18CS02]
MRVLIVGLGYAGTRFRTAFENAGEKAGESMAFAHVGRNGPRSDIPYYDSVHRALAGFGPDVVVVTVPDEAHAAVLSELAGYEGFVVAEKPLTTSRDDTTAVESALAKVSGFCLDLVERYSEATVFLRDHIRRNGLRLVRAHFTWGKDRINDHRPTSGVPSEVVHPLDLVQWIAGDGERIALESALGTRSDFSVSGPEVLDSVALAGRLASGTVTGYSSFVSITRKREVDFVLRSPEGGLVYANTVYDTPAWDADRLRIWRRTDDGDEVIHELNTGDRPVPPGAGTVVKLGRMAADVTSFVVSGRRPGIPFPGLADALGLQHLLDTVEREVRTTGPVTYFPDGRTVLREADWERLG